MKDVSFEVKPGEALGIIGPNGAGKSHALKLLTRILRPNAAQCAVRGRVGALIEVAAGFHPDLTGRENIYLQGAIMGMTPRARSPRASTRSSSSPASATFIDTQVKRYSSGMNARLGFAIAAHLDPDVLIIDEVLSVGDMGFQAEVHRPDAAADRATASRSSSCRTTCRPSRICARDASCWAAGNCSSTASRKRVCPCTSRRARPSARVTAPSRGFV